MKIRIRDFLTLALIGFILYFLGAYIFAPYF